MKRHDDLPENSLNKNTTVNRRATHNSKRVLNQKPGKGAMQSRAIGIATRNIHQSLAESATIPANCCALQSARAHLFNLQHNTLGVGTISRLHLLNQCQEFRLCTRRRLKVILPISCLRLISLTFNRQVVDANVFD